MQPIDFGNARMLHLAYTSTDIRPGNTGQANYRISQNELFGDKQVIMPMGRSSRIF